MCHEFQWIQHIKCTMKILWIPWWPYEILVRKHYENAVNFWCYAFMVIYNICVCLCVCVYVCAYIHIRAHIKISYTKICTDKNYYICITKLHRYIATYISYQYGTVHDFSEIKLVKEFIVWILYESYINQIYKWYGKFKGSWFTTQR